MKRCPRCKAERPAEDFPRDRTRPDGRFSWCKSCARANSRKHYWANPEQNRVRLREWYENLTGPQYNALLLRGRRQKALVRMAERNERRES